MASSSVNKVILLGHLGRDPELKYTQSGLAMASFTLATSGPGGRDREPATEWHKVVVWDKLAELCSQYLTKGRQVYMEGRLQTRQWDDKQTGQKRYTTEIVANQVLFLGGGASQARGAGGPEVPGEPRGNWNSRGNQNPREAFGDTGPESDEMPPPSFPDDDDIPF